MNIWIILLILLALGFFGGMPNWGYHHYGWGPSGGIGLIFVVLIILLLLGRI